MIRRLVFALLLAAAPTLGQTQVRGSLTLDALTVSGAASAGSIVTPSLVLGSFTLTGVGTTAGTLAAGNDSRIVGAVQTGSAASLASLALTTPLPLTQGGCGATSALGCLTNLGISSGTLGQILTSNGPGTAPTFQPPAAVANAVLYTAQTLTAGQQDQVRANLSGPSPAFDTTSATLAVTDIDRPRYPTNAITLTAPNGGAGWRTGPILNSNATAGIVTLAVPSGATLDGTANGTALLFPKQKARVLQTGATAYVTDFIDRPPVVFAQMSGAAAASWTVPIPAGYGSFKITITGILPSTSGQQLIAQLSDDGGVTFKSGASDYGYHYLDAAGTSVGANQTNASSIPITAGVATGFNKATAEVLLVPGGGGDMPVITSRSFNANTSSLFEQTFYGGRCSAISTNRANALKLSWTSGTGVAAITVQALP